MLVWSPTNVWHAWLVPRRHSQGRAQLGFASDSRSTPKPMFDAVAGCLHVLFWLAVVTFVVFAIVDVVRRKSAGFPMTAGAAVLLIGAGYSLEPWRRGSEIVEWMHRGVWLALAGLLLFAMVAFVWTKDAAVPVTTRSFAVRLFALAGAVAVGADALAFYFGSEGICLLVPIALLAALVASTSAIVVIGRACQRRSRRNLLLGAVVLLTGVGLWGGLITRRTYLLGGFLMYVRHASELSGFEHGYDVARDTLTLPTRPPTERRVPSNRFRGVFEVRNESGYELRVVVNTLALGGMHCLVFSPHGRPRGLHGFDGLCMHLIGDWYVTSGEWQ
jgi:hypothetical protein